MKTLKQLRIDSGLTLQQVASKLQKELKKEFSRQTIQSWEAGRSYPHIRYAIPLSKIYGVSVETVLEAMFPHYDA